MEAKEGPSTSSNAARGSISSSRVASRRVSLSLFFVCSDFLCRGGGEHAFHLRLGLRLLRSIDPTGRHSRVVKKGGIDYSYRSREMELEGEREQESGIRGIALKKKKKSTETGAPHKNKKRPPCWPFICTFFKTARLCFWSARGVFLPPPARKGYLHQSFWPMRRGSSKPPPRAEKKSSEEEQRALF